MLVLLFICLLKHWMKINTALRVMSGLWVWSIMRCWLEKHHGEPKLKNNWQNSWFPFQLKNYSRLPSVNLLNISYWRHWQLTSTKEWHHNKYKDIHLLSIKEIFPSIFTPHKIPCLMVETIISSNATKISQEWSIVTKHLLTKTQ